MKMHLAALVLFALTLCWPAPSRAQTPESVLRALQERQMMLEIRRVQIGGSGPLKPIVWPDNLADFPAPGTIDTVPQVVTALNRASVEFDRIKAEFLSYDPARKRLVNFKSENRNAEGGNTALYDSPRPSQVMVAASIRIPSVGLVDESNWRGKLRQLASDVDQLQALRWPVAYRLGSLAEIPPDLSSGATISYPEVNGAETSNSGDQLVPATLTPGPALQWEPAGVPNTFLYCNAMVGLHATMRPLSGGITVPPETPGSGQMLVFKTPSVASLAFQKAG